MLILLLSLHAYACGGLVGVFFLFWNRNMLFVSFSGVFRIRTETKGLLATAQHYQTPARF
jgi:hypothetical protein